MPGFSRDGRWVTTDTAPVAAVDVARPVPRMSGVWSTVRRLWMPGFAAVAALGVFLAGAGALVLAVRGL